MGILPMVLAFGTLGFVTVLGYLGARATEELKNDPDHKPSTLCAKSGQWAAQRR